MPYSVYKNIGETPFDIIKSFREKKKNKYSFAGRLDPMARGKMIILEGDECKKQESYCNYNKIYEFQILFGFSTDTYDILGLLKKYNIIDSLPNIKLDNYLGKKTQAYPPYSSIIVNKQPLWWWSREGRLNEITIPSKEVEIQKLEFLEDIFIENNLVLLQQIENKIGMLDSNRHTDFRVDSILKKWREVLLHNNGIPIIKKYRASVTSGTYIRSLVHQIGKDLGLGAIAWDIHRTEFIVK